MCGVDVMWVLDEFVEMPATFLKITSKFVFRLLRFLLRKPS